MDRLLEAGKADTALHLSAALQAFCGRLGQLRQELEPFTGWTDLILTQEGRFRDVRVPVGSTRVFLNGMVDALRLRPGQGLEIVDYKLSRGANLRYDLLQVAVYVHLLRVTEGGLAFRGCPEYYLPALEALEISADELAEIFDDLVLPTLHEMTGESLSATVASPEVAWLPARPPRTIPPRGSRLAPGRSSCWSRSPDARKRRNSSVISCDRRRRAGGVPSQPG